jgi:hypothetical protein
MEVKQSQVYWSAFFCAKKRDSAVLSGFLKACKKKGNSHLEQKTTSETNFFSKLNDCPVLYQDLD